MKVTVTPGKYVVAVSGGVDSMSLLHALHQQPEVSLVAAHFDHGIREDSDEDRKLVAKVASKYGIPFAFERAELGPTASEDLARKARYAFLRRIKRAAEAQAIITAHHQDDVIETAVLNMLRGTGRKGLSSLGSTPEIVRPLLHISKAEIKEYATKHSIPWHEDFTNQNEKYLRNYIRKNIIPRLKGDGKKQLLNYIAKLNEINPTIDMLLLHGLQEQPAHNQLDRQWFIELPYDVSCEVMAAWLRQHDIRDFDKKKIERLVVGAKTAPPGKTYDINAQKVLLINKASLTLAPR